MEDWCHCRKSCDYGRVSALDDHTIVNCVPLLFGADVDATCSLPSLHLVFYADDVWEYTWVEHFEIGI